MVVIFSPFGAIISLWKSLGIFWGKFAAELAIPLRVCVCVVGGGTLGPKRRAVCGNEISNLEYYYSVSCFATSIPQIGMRVKRWCQSTIHIFFCSLVRFEIREIANPLFFRRIKQPTNAWAAESAGAAAAAGSSLWGASGGAAPPEGAQWSARSPKLRPLSRGGAILRNKEEHGILFSNTEHCRPNFLKPRESKNYQQILTETPEYGVFIRRIPQT